uniref:Uncharacterized protein n=1 Tax=Sphaerodactylus townsendi TaxID=933632 RepID=A0ACB8FDL0_9SAUR
MLSTNRAADRHSLDLVLLTLAGATAFLQVLRSSKHDQKQLGLRHLTVEQHQVFPHGVLQRHPFRGGNVIFTQLNQNCIREAKLKNGIPQLEKQSRPHHASSRQPANVHRGVQAQMFSPARFLRVAPSPVHNTVSNQPNLIMMGHRNYKENKVTAKGLLSDCFSVSEGEIGPGYQQARLSALLEFII